MGLQDRIEEDLKTALRSGDRTRLGALRLSLAALRNAAIDKGQQLDDAEVLAVLQKQAKKHRESIEEFTKGNRADLIAKEEAELAVVEAYLPKQLTREEVADIARRIIAEVGAQGPRDMGKVMPKLMAELQGRADGKLASQVVQQILGER